MLLLLLPAWHCASYDCLSILLCSLHLFSCIRVYSSGCISSVVTHAGGSRAVGRVTSGVCDVCVCVPACPRSKRKKARAINTELGYHTVLGSRSACIDPEVKRSRVKVTLPARVCTSTGLLGFSNSERRCMMMRAAAVCKGLHAARCHSVVHAVGAGERGTYLRPLIVFHCV